MIDLSGKTALVTGGSKGIGKSIARALAEHGADVAITGRNKDTLESSIKDITAGTKSRGYTYVFDHVNWRQTHLLVNTIHHDVERIDILVNNAGTGLVREIEKMKDEEWEHMYSLLISSPMALCRLLVPGMKEKRWGRIVNIASVLGVVGREMRTAYCCFKGGLISFTRALAIELANYNITVNSVSPGQFLTPLTEGMYKDPKKYNGVTSLIPFGRWGDVDEIKGVILLLCSELGSFITGQNILIDGGWSI